MKTRWTQFLVCLTWLSTPPQTISAVEKSGRGGAGSSTSPRVRGETYGPLTTSLRHPRHAGRGRHEVGGVCDRLRDGCAACSGGPTSAGKQLGQGQRGSARDLRHGPGDRG